MSYRSLRDILGETSLERKVRFLFGLCLFVLIAGSFWWYGNRTEQLVYSSGRATGRHVVDAIMLQHHWKMLESEQATSSSMVCACVSGGCFEVCAGCLLALSLQKAGVQLVATSIFTLLV